MNLGAINDDPYTGNFPLQAASQADQNFDDLYFHGQL